MICTAIDPLLKFRHDPYPWANQPIAFAGGPHGLQACRFSKAAPWPSISGDTKWLLELDEPVIRSVHVDTTGLSELDKAESQRVKLHYTKLVWAEECLPQAPQGVFDLPNPGGMPSYPQHNGSIVEIPDQCFTHLRRADFVNGYCVLDRYVAMYLLYVDDDRPPVVQGCKRFVIRPGVAFGFSMQGVTLRKKVPYCLVGNMQRFTDEAYSSPDGRFDFKVAQGLDCGRVRL